MQQFVFNFVNSILLNLLSCLPFGLQTGISSFLELAEPSPVKDFPAYGGEFKITSGANIKKQKTEF